MAASSKSCGTSRNSCVVGVSVERGGTAVASSKCSGTSGRSTGSSGGVLVVVTISLLAVIAIAVWW